MGQLLNLNLTETAALAYLRERGGSIFVNEAPPQTVNGFFGKPIAGLEAYQALCMKGIARINTRRDHGDARYGDTFEVVQNDQDQQGTRTQA